MMTHDHVVYEINGLYLAEIRRFFPMIVFVEIRQSIVRAEGILKFKRKG